MEANVHEAQGAQSRADFVAKMSIAFKEAKETEYWVELIKLELKLLDSEFKKLENETQELIKILSSILISAKANQNS